MIPPHSIPHFCLSLPPADTDRTQRRDHALTRHRFLHLKTRCQSRSSESWLRWLPIPERAQVLSSAPGRPTSSPTVGDYREQNAGRVSLGTALVQRPTMDRYRAQASSTYSLPRLMQHGSTPNSQWNSLCMHSTAPRGAVPSSGEDAFNTMFGQRLLALSAPRDNTACDPLMYINRAYGQ